MKNCSMPGCDGIVKRDFRVDFKERSGIMHQIFPCGKCGRLHTISRKSAEGFNVFTRSGARCMVYIDLESRTILYKDGEGNILETESTFPTKP